MRKDTVMTSSYCRSLFSLVWPLPLPQLSPLPMLATAMLAILLAMLLPPMLMVSKFSRGKFQRLFVIVKYNFLKGEM